MYCVIQKVQNKRKDVYGENKELLVDHTTWSMGEELPKTKYRFKYSVERYKRPILDAYKISIHKSYREEGKVKKQQWVICTIGYYNLLESWPGDFVKHDELEAKLAEMGITEGELWNMVYLKLDPIIKRIKEEFEKTEEYAAKINHKQTITAYQLAKNTFELQYGADTYDYCYDLYGTLRNEEYLNKVQSEYQAKQNYQRSYYDSQQSNHGNYDFGSYFTNKQSTYTDQETQFLKTIYKAAAMKMHPDIIKDGGEGMKFLNGLKEEWGI